MFLKLDQWIWVPSTGTYPRYKHLHLHRRRINGDSMPIRKRHSKLSQMPANSGSLTIESCDFVVSVPKTNAMLRCMFYDVCYDVCTYMYIYVYILGAPLFAGYRWAKNVV